MSHLSKLVPSITKKTNIHNKPRSICQYSNMAQSFRVKIVNFFCLTIPKRDLDTQKTTPNIEVCPESPGAMLEY